MRLEVPRVLVVDDNDAFRRGIARWVRQLGYEPTEAATATQALEWIDDDSSFAAILLDLRLPDADGHAVLRQLGRAHVTVPVIIMSGHASMDDAVLALREHASDLLQKPFGLSDLESALSRVAVDATPVSVPAPAPARPSSSVDRPDDERAPLGPRARAPEQVPLDGIRPVVAQLRERLRAGRIDLPVVDTRVGQLQELMSGTDVDVAALTALLERDTSLAAGVLRVANSAYYRRSTETRTIRDACVRIGAKRVVVIAMESVIAPKATELSQPYVDRIRRLWRSALVTSRIAAALAGGLRRHDVEEVQLVALLHNLGETLLVQLLGEIDTGGGFAEEDIAHYVSKLHERFGEALARSWDLPGVVTRVAGSHHLDVPTHPSDADVTRLLVLAAWKMAAEAGYAPFSSQPAEDYSRELAALRVPGDLAERVLRDAKGWGVE